ncbi:MAG TPA: hypothetical protein VFP79_00270 [Pseudolabrys sp.]|nr:hypothetical protein [Pseudolabrys sp.]
MSTLDIHRSTSALPAGLTRFVALLNVLLEAFVEAQRRAAAAHKRYPFAEW